MPQVIPYVVGYALQGYGWIQVVAVVAASVVVADYQRTQAQNKARAAAAAAARDRTVTLRSGVSPRRMVLGTARIGGTLMYGEFVGDDEQYLDTIVAIHHGEMAEVLGVYMDDEWIPASALASGAPTSGKYSGAEAQADRITKVATLTAESTVTLDDVPNSLTDVHAILNLSGTSVGADASHQPLTISSVVGNVVTLSAPVTGEVWVTYSTNANPRVPLKVQWAMGATSQATTTWAGVTTPKWTADHRLRGVGYLRTLTLLEHEVFATGTPQGSLVVRGPKGVYDPRTSTTLTTTSNPALLAAWFRTLPRSEGGMGVPSNWIDWATVATAANVCDELITVKKLDGTGTESIKRYECNTVISLDQPPADNLRVILDAMAGEFPFTGGQYRCFAGAFRPATLTLTDADVCGDKPITFAPAVGADQAPPNVVTATIYSSAHNWVETGAPAVANTAYITADGQEEPLEIDLPATTDLRQANYLMGVRLEQMRPALAGSITVLGAGADIALMDTLQINLAGYEALAGKTFEVRRRTNHWNGRYTLDLREVKASTYALDTERFVPPTEVPPTDTTGLWKPAKVTLTSVVNATLVQTDGTRLNRALVTWAAHPQSTINPGGTIELRYRAPATEWIYVPAVPGSQLNAYIGPLAVGTTIFVEARARNGLGATSEWAGIAPFLVTGSNDVVPDVTGLTHAIKPGQVQVQWDRWADPSYLETELRVGASWAAGTFLWAGAGSEYQHPRPANGTYTVWAKHRNRSGGESATAASRVVTVDDSIEPGAPDSLYVEWSVDGSTGWHSTFTTGDVYARWRVGTGGAWQGPFKAVGEDGETGPRTAFVFKRAATLPATPTGDTPAGWADAPPAADGNPLWASTANKDGAGHVVGAWSTPVQIEGARGSDGVAFSIQATAAAVTFAGDGTTYKPASQTITFAAQRTGLSGTVTWSVTAYNASGTAIGNRWPNGATGDTQSMSESQFTGGGSTTAYVRVTATLGAYSDTVTIMKLTDGASTVSGYLTNESVTLAADKDGNLVGSLSSLTAGVFKVYQGTTDVTASASFGVSATSSCTISGPSAGSGAYNAASMSADSAWADLTASYAGVTITRRLSLAKARAGATGTGTPGASGASAVYAYQIVNSSSLPSAPAVPSGAPTAGNASTPGVWYSQPPSGSLGTGQWLFQASGTLSGSTYTWVSPSYLATFRVGNLAALSADVDGSLFINVTAPWDGTTYINVSCALRANNSLGSAVGMAAFSSNSSATAIYGYNSNTSGGSGLAGYGFIGVAGRTSVSGSTGIGVQGGSSGSGTGVKGDSSSGPGVWGVSTSGPGGRFSSLRLDQTPTTGSGTATFTATNKPGGSSANTWLSINLNGTTYQVPVWS